ncbi:MAG: hypothetical protein BGO67_03605 [Alphaproteobacteria bacterium 41-28]|nr:MAG: hypothetical protein BGO67_03605 [Alphaproteobacteria bacterium 41-28]
MLTAVRINQNLKNRISTLPFLSSNVKSFSHALRYLVDLGLKTFDNSLGLINKGTETNIRFIAQKHDLGDQLSDTEIFFLLSSVESALSARSFVHQETMHTLSEAFASFVKSRCYAANHHTIHIFKKFNLVSIALEDKVGGDAVVSLLSRGFYQCMEEVAETFKSKLQASPCPLKDYSLIEPLKAFVSCLAYFSQGKGEHILSPLAFRQALQPYLTSFIQIAKGAFHREEVGGQTGNPPYHTVSQKLFVHQHELEKPFHFRSTSYSCHVFANDLDNVQASFVFEKKGATLSLGFSAFDDLLEMARYIARFSFSKAQLNERGSIKFETSKLSFLWDSEVQEKISALLRAKGSSFMLDSEETQEFIEFLVRISEEFNEPLKALRYQLGSI